MLGLSCGIWDLVPRPGIEPRPPALRTWSLNHWTIRKNPNVRPLCQEVLSDASSHLTLMKTPWALSPFL